MSYCSFVEQLPLDNVHRVYHDHHYGVPISSDDELFGRLILEINQAGLSWETILKKEQGFRLAYDQFSISKIATYDEDKVEELMNNPAIIRNRLKILAAIHNAKKVLEIQKEFGSFKTWLDQQHLTDIKDWVKLFKKQFKFVGGEIVNEFLMSTAYLPGAHSDNCFLKKS